MPQSNMKYNKKILISLRTFFHGSFAPLPSETRYDMKKKLQKLFIVIHTSCKKEQYIQTTKEKDHPTTLCLVHS